MSTVKPGSPHLSPRAERKLNWLVALVHLCKTIFIIHTIMPNVIYTGFIFSTLLLLVHSQGFANLDGLGQRISESVRRNLEPLKNIGPMIKASVNNQLGPVRQSFASFRNQEAYDSRSDELDNEFSSLEGLGDRINQAVNAGLEPVRAMEIYFHMKDGIGGTTIITHFPGGKQFIAQNRQMYECTGTISPTGQCSGERTLFQINKNSDYCYFKNSVSIINDQICIGSTSVSVINNIVKCENSFGQPVLSMKINDYNQMCRGLSDTVEYKYIANPIDPAHVEIPNRNKHVKCNNNEPNVCVFQETGNIQYSQTIINNGNNHNVVIVN